MIRAGAVLSARVVITFSCIMYGSAMTVQTGAANQAAFEILRQVWLVSMQVRGSCPQQPRRVGQVSCLGSSRGQGQCLQGQGCLPAAQHGVQGGLPPSDMGPPALCSWRCAPLLCLRPPPPNGLHHC